MNRGFFTTVLKTKPELLRAMLAFNGLQVFPPFPDPLAAFPNAEVLWAQVAVRRQFGVPCTAEPDFWDFEDEALRLAFLDAQTIKRLALTFGVAIIAPDLCRLLRRDAVRDARERLGDALYAYALHRARFQVRADVVPEIFLPEGSPVDIRAQAIGAQSLSALCTGWPEPLRSRFMASVAVHTAASEPELGAEQKKQLWGVIKKVLLKEVAPSWAPCFD